MEHHAYLILSDPDTGLSFVPENDRNAHADVSVHSFDRLGVQDARTLSSEASRAPFEHTHRVMILAAHDLTVEAQNALLKLFEDPPPTARFYLIVPAQANLLPTLLSRLHVLHNGSPVECSADVATSFLKASYAERLTLIESHHKRDDGDWFTVVLDGLESSLSPETEPDAVREILLVRKYVSGSGASKKMLFDHLALSLPERR